MIPCWESFVRVSADHFQIYEHLQKIPWSGDSLNFFANGSLGSLRKIDFPFFAFLSLFLSLHLSTLHGDLKNFPRLMVPCSATFINPCCDRARRLRKLSHKNISRVCDRFSGRSGGETLLGIEPCPR